MSKLTLTLIAIGNLWVSTTGAGAQELNWTPENEFHAVEQTGLSTLQIREDLKKIKLPWGFEIDVFAIVPDAGQIAVSPQGAVVFVSTGKGEIWAIADRNKDRIADEVVRFAPGLLRSASGICFSKDGFLYAVEHNRVLIFPAAELAFDYQRAVFDEIVPQGALLPPGSVTGSSHMCDVGPDNKLYIWLEQLSKVPAESAALHKKPGLGGLIRLDRDGGNRKVYKDSEHRADMVSPDMLAYTGSSFPEKYRRGVFSIQSSSRNGGPSIDIRIMFTSTSAVDKDRQAEVFGEGWSQQSDEMAAPLVDMTQLHDGSILLSDQQKGAIYRIAYKKE